MVTNDQVDEIERFLKFLGNIFLQKYSLAFGAYFEKTLVILLSGNFGEIGLLFSLTFWSHWSSSSSSSLKTFRSKRRRSRQNGFFLNFVWSFGERKKDRKKANFGNGRRRSLRFQANWTFSEKKFWLQNGFWKIDIIRSFIFGYSRFLWSHQYSREQSHLGSRSTLVLCAYISY